MNQQKIDRRTKYTKTALKEALLKLMVDTDVNKITVKELCEVADINRVTFYKYYQDAQDLLVQIELELFNELKLSVNDSMNDKTMNFFILNVMNIIYSNKDICKNIFSEHGNQDFIKDILYLAHDKCLIEWKSKFPDFSKKELEYLFSYTAGGSIGIVHQWLRTNCKEKPQEIAVLIENISNKSFETYSK